MESFLQALKIIGLLILAGVAGWIWFARERDKRRQEEYLRKRYSDSLALLRRENSPANRVAALGAGRAYMNFMRARYQDSNRTIIDEVQIQNDLLAHGG